MNFERLPRLYEIEYVRHNMSSAGFAEAQKKRIELF